MKLIAIPLLLVLFTLVDNCWANDLFSGCTVEEYYQSIDLTSSNNVLKSDLQNLVTSTHRRVLDYTDSSNGGNEDDVWKALMDLDVGTSSSSTVHLIYRDVDIEASLFNVPDGGWNREHVWPKSLGVGTGGADFTDIHHLRPSDWNVNAARSNKYFASCFVANSCRIPATAEAAGDTASSTDTWLPPVSARGAVARAILYMELRYAPYLSLTDCPSDSSTEMAYRSELLEWNAMYPPTEEELVRNDKACARWQGNRNPFVDFSNLVPQLFGEAATWPYTCGNPTASPPTPSSPTTGSPSPTCTGPGSVMLTQVNADNPDLVGMVALQDLPRGMTIVMTDNAWSRGTGFCSNEGTVKRTLLENVSAGTILSYKNDDEDWEKVQGSFSLSTSGDSIILYCESSTEVGSTEIVFLSALSFAGDWLGNNEASDCGTSQTELPLSLDGTAAVALPHSDNYRYVGTREGSSSDVRSSMTRPRNWMASQNDGFTLDTAAFKVSSCSTLRVLDSAGLLFPLYLVVWFYYFS